jgi:hypothetical protein
MTITKTFLRDLAERAISTYLQVVLPAITLAVLSDTALLWPVLLSGIPAVLSMIKSVIAEKWVPGTISPASFARSTSPANYVPRLTVDKYRDEQ